VIEGCDIASDSLACIAVHGNAYPRIICNKIHDGKNSGVYVYGGSWFLNDAANYMDGLIHGMPPEWVDDKLLWRLEKELAYMPAFHESISTVNGKPHGHHLYSWNSGFWWLRREIRARLGMTGPDPLAARLDAEYGISRRDGQLIFDPAAAPERKKP